MSDASTAGREGRGTDDLTVCPFCREEVKADAIKCKHCASALPQSTPVHDGICPFCKEEIHPEAVKCKHCRTMLGSTGSVAAGVTSDQVITRLEFRRSDSYPLALGPRLPVI